MLKIILAISIPIITVTLGITLGLLLTNLIDYRAITKQKEVYLKYSKGSRTLSPYKIPKFTFHQFLTFYVLNPESWELQTDFDQYVPAKRELSDTGTLDNDISVVRTYVAGKYGYTQMYTIMHPIFFKNFFEYLKYKRWVKHTLKVNQVAEINEAQLHNTQTIVNLVQKDIDKMMDESHNDIERTAARVADIYIRLNQEATK